LGVRALVVGAVMLVIAASHWLESFRADRRALRRFALRYAAAAFGWWFAHPRARVRRPGHAGADAGGR
jgi:hypothetical protein